MMDCYLEKSKTQRYIAKYGEAVRSDRLPVAVEKVPEPTSPQALPESVIKQLRVVIEPDLLIESMTTPREAAKDGVLVMRGRLTRPSHIAFPRWQTTLAGMGYTPTLRSVAAETGQRSAPPEDVFVRIFAGVVQPTASRAWINAVLFVATLWSTLLVGATNVLEPTAWADVVSPSYLINGLPFSATLLVILLAHEFGHYFAARYHRVAVTLPYFLPMPIGFGTFGAFIRLKEPISDRRKLFDIGVAGPLAGLIVGLPLLLYGLSISTVDVPPPNTSYMIEGNSLLYLGLKYLLFGQILPNPITGADVFISQIAFAGWIGLLVTALNLLPVGQLDGGHTVFALFGRKARVINLASMGILAVLALASLPGIQSVIPGLENVGFTGWFIWLVLLLLIGIEHPPALDDVTQLDNRRRLIGYLVIMIFILTFVPVPIRIVG